MAFVVEDGTGRSDANSYAAEATADEYFEARANTVWATNTGDKEAALIRATAAIDAAYRARFPGYRLQGRSQALEWPRYGAYDVEGLLIASDGVPIEVVRATCEAAVRELAVPGAMIPDLERGGWIKNFKAGSVAVEFGANAAPGTVFSLIDGILSGILAGGSAGGLFGVAVRG